MALCCDRFYFIINNERKFHVMGTEFANKHIGCNVKSCEYHCVSDNYCSLDRIEVGTHECDPSQKQCTDCMSFKQKNC